MKSDDITYSAITAEPVESAETTVEVIAPATLQAGYVFNATYEGTIFRVDVVSKIILIISQKLKLALKHSTIFIYSSIEA